MDFYRKCQTSLFPGMDACSVLSSGGSCSPAATLGWTGRAFCHRLCPCRVVTWSGTLLCLCKDRQ